MPDLSKCVRHEGKTYCWDNAAGTVVEIRITDVPFEKVPQDVLRIMLSDTQTKTTLN